MRKLIISCRNGTSRNSVVIHKVTRHNNSSNIFNNICYASSVELKDRHISIIHGEFVCGVPYLLII